MSTDSEIITKSAQVMFNSANPPAEQGSPAVVAVPGVTPPAETPGLATIVAEDPATPAVGNTASPAVTEEAKPAATNEPYNYWPDLDQQTEGLVKDQDSLKTVLEKYRSYDTLATEKAELEKNQFKPANEYVETLNGLIQNGANKDQIKAFVKLNEYGNLEDLNPVEAKIAKMVLIDGYSEEIARKAINRNFDFSQFDEEVPAQKDDADIMREELRISAKNDLNALKGYRKDLSVVHNPEKESAEQAKLAEIASISTYNKTIETEAPKIAKVFPEKLTFEIKLGDEVINFEDSIDPEFMAKEGVALFTDYFKDSLDPLTQETVAQANSFVYGEYLKTNISKMVERAYQKGDAAGAERMVNKYENRSGLPKAQENTIIAANESGLNEFINTRLLGKK